MTRSTRKPSTASFSAEIRPHEVAVRVVDDDPLSRRRLAVDHDLLGREDVGKRRVRARDRLVRLAVQAHRRPGGAGGDDDQLGPVLAHGLGVEPQVRDHLDVAQLVQLDPAPIHDPTPLAAPGKLRDPAHDPADVVARVDEVNPAEAALAEDDRALHPGRAGADDEHVAVAVLGGLEALGVPAAPVLLAGRGVLGAADVPAGIRLRDADVAADALADLVQAPLLDLAREERVGDGRARGSDDVPDAARDDLGHPIRVGQARDADDRLRGRLAHVLRPLQLPPLREEARRARVLRPLGRGADRHVPEVDEVVGSPYEREPLVQVDAERAQRGDGDAGGDGALAADGLPRQLEQLEPEAGAVLEGAAVGVRPPVVERREELHGQVAVRAVDVDDVEPRLAGTARRGGPVSLDAPDVVALHRLRRHEQVVAGQLGGRDRREPVLAARAVRARVVELDAGQRARARAPRRTSARARARRRRPRGARR